MHRLALHGNMKALQNTSAEAMAAVDEAVRTAQQPVERVVLPRLLTQLQLQLLGQLQTQNCVSYSYRRCFAAFPPSSWGAEARS